MKNLRVYGLLAALLVAVAIAVAPQPKIAEAQQGGLTYSKTGNTFVGNFIAVFNLVDSTIYKGEVVMADTQTTAAGGLKRVGVKHYDGTALGRIRVVGVAAQDIPKSSKQGTGMVLTSGYCPVMYLDASNVAINQPIKIGPTVACFTKIDSLNGACGYVISRTSATADTKNTGPRYTYKGYFWGPRMTGATL